MRVPQQTHRSIRKYQICKSTTLLLAVGVTFFSARAQTPSQSAQFSGCTRDEALQLIKQQIEDATTIGDPTQRIAVLIRAADLLWPYEQKTARSTFMKAFDLAIQHFAETGDAPKMEGRGLLVETPDQRYVVIRTIAKRDPQWAQKLTKQILDQDQSDAAGANGVDDQQRVRAAWKLLTAATNLLTSDPATAVSFANMSLSYPASIELTRFLYRFAEVDQRGADECYRRALAAYSNKSLGEFLYLSAYPFALDSTGDMPWSGPYVVPASFSPDNSVRRPFTQTLIRRAQLTLQGVSGSGDDYNDFPAAGHILQVLTRTQADVSRFLPDLSPAVNETRNNLMATLSPERQSLFLKPGDSETRSRRTFDEQVETAERQANVNRRDELLVTAILNSVQSEQLEKIVLASDKISDSAVRTQLLDWVYFMSCQKALKDKNLTEARVLAGRVQELDQRAYLYSEIAKESLRKIETESQARELLEEIVSTASKASRTIVAARTLLAAAYLYARIDPNRSIPILGEAIKTINALDQPDFSRQSLTRKIEGKTFARYAVYRTAGFDPENAFREMGAIGFQDLLSQASTLNDKRLRALTTLALADVCLQQAKQAEKKKPPLTR